MSIARVRERMEERGIDARIAAGPESFTFVTGYPCVILYIARVARLAMAVKPLGGENFGVPGNE